MGVDGAAEKGIKRWPIRFGWELWFEPASEMVTERDSSPCLQLVGDSARNDREGRS